ncbi:MAG: adenylate/guanylate cyclase domain-containing protein [Verrucomicrobiae bacterium]|nr:adenylate/guanylate cyclase domain-containing protein [Verrucomicrobiae bacterium]
MSRLRLYTLLAPLAGAALLALLGTGGALARVENLTRDWRFQFRAPRDPAADDRLLLVAIEEHSLDLFGRWPWPRSIHGEFAQLLALAPPSALAFDILFPEAQNPKEDLAFAQGLARGPSAVLGAFRNAEPDAKKISDPGMTRPIPLRNLEGELSRCHGAEGALLPIPPLREVARFGFTDSEPTSSDGVRREVPLVIRIGEQIWPSLSLQALLLHWKVSPDKVRLVLNREIQIPTSHGVERIPIDEKGSFRINYRAPRRFAMVNYRGLATTLLNFNKGAEWDSRCPNPEGRILVVGQTAAGLTDFGPSPLDPKSPLVHVHLNVLNNVLRHDYLRAISWAWALPVWLTVAWLSLRLLEGARIATCVLVPAFAVFAYFALTFGVFERWSLELPVSDPTLAFVLLHSGAVLLRWREDQRSKQEIRAVFASYIAPKVMEQLLRHPENVKLGGVRKPVAVLFSDIRGFTSIAEQANEEALVVQLNEYFTRMVDCVVRHDGTLHKYIGDAIMAVWGDVVDAPEEENARRAVRAALDMRLELVRLNAVWKAQGRLELRIGIGLNHGLVVVGNLGAPQRKEFTVIGDAVNLGSRLEGVTKEFKTDLAISETVAKLLDDHFLLRTLGLIQVKGKTKPVRVFEVLDDREASTGTRTAPWVADYEKAFARYLAHDFDGAAVEFERLEKAHAGDFCCALYARECRRLAVEPPPKEWQGVVMMETK